MPRSTTPRKPELGPVPRRGRALVGVFAVALALRFLHLALIRNAPFFDLRLGDAITYDAWARTIVQGDWIGHGVFYQAPLYPYFLAMVYLTLGDSVAVVRIVQAILSAAGCVLVADAGWRLFSKRAGIAAGLLLACYPPSIFLDTLFQKSALDSLLVCLVVWLVVRIVRSAEASRYGSATAVFIALGLAVGALMLTRENAIVLAAPILIWLVVRRNVDARSRFREAGAFVIGAAVVLAPVAVRNTVQGGALTITSSQFGSNLYIGNGPEANGIYRALKPWRGSADFEQQDAVAIAEHAVGHPLRPSEVSAYYTRETIRFIASQPRRWAGLLWRKLRLALNANEVADTEDQYTYGEWSWLLKVGAIWNFAALAALGAAGVWITRRDGRVVWVLYAMELAYLASLVLFYVVARYRSPLVPILMLFAGAALAGATSFARSRPRRETGALAVAIAGIFLFCWWPIWPARAAQKAVTHYNVGTALTARGDAAAAIAEFRAATALDPALTMAKYQLGVSLAGRDDLAQAADALRDTIRQLPSYAPAHNNLGVVLGRMGRFGEAESEFRAALASDPKYAQAHNNLGQMLAARHDAPAAIREFEEASALDPEYPDPRRSLAAAYADAGDVARASAAYQQLLALVPDDADARSNLAMLLARAGNLDAAADQFRAVLRAEPGRADVHNNLALVLAQQGQLDQARAEFERALAIDPSLVQARRGLERIQRK